MTEGSVEVIQNLLDAKAKTAEETVYIIRIENTEKESGKFCMHTPFFRTINVVCPRFIARQKSRRQASQGESIGRTSALASSSNTCLDYSHTSPPGVEKQQTFNGLHDIGQEPNTLPDHPWAFKKPDTNPSTTIDDEHHHNLLPVSTSSSQDQTYLGMPATMAGADDQAFQGVSQYGIF
ncbi:hypothetical protein BPOR_0068g00240 [Botrytis porri]|uniref:Uncharacterized protein n=1 Tax=Botrytis porri TaxID=87229 RepID=A0A4Z1L0V5_9HELO|nr:hypothetical protein BPOR_0068g00240 [Botrytis porri]